MKYYLLTILSIGLILSSCKKANLKKPSQIDVIVNTDTTESHSNSVNYKSTEFLIQTFTIKGDRVEGESIDFARTLNEPVMITGETSEIEELKFDIPQGQYSELSIIIETTEAKFNSKYKLSNGPTVDVIFEIENPTLFSINCNNQEDYITLDTKIANILNIQLNPIHWLNSLTNDQLDNADLTIGNSGVGLGNNTVLINSSNNISLYTNILNEIGNGNTANIFSK